MYRTASEIYEKKSYVREAALCLSERGERNLLYGLFTRWPDRILFETDSLQHIIDMSRDDSRDLYMRGMAARMAGNIDLLHRVMERVRKVDTEDAEEVLLNLAYVDPDMTLSKWFDVLGAINKKRGDRKLRLYSMAGTGVSYLCGLRDLGEMYAGSEAEQNTLARIWKESFGIREWNGYCMARLEYEIETGKEDISANEISRLLLSDSETAADSGVRHYCSQLYLLIRSEITGRGDRFSSRMDELYEMIALYGNDIIRRIAAGIMALYDSCRGRKDRLSAWIRDNHDLADAQVCEENYPLLMVFCSGRMKSGRYRTAEKLVLLLTDFFRGTRRDRLLTECIFYDSIIKRKEYRTSRWLALVQASFELASTKKYVLLYTLAGRNGEEVFAGYAKWLKCCGTDDRSGLLRHDYQTALNGPTADYFEYVSRQTSGNVSRKLSRAGSDRHMLTRTEQRILRKLADGLTYAEICDESNVKLGTVKAHVYSIYKKLGVNSRMQAVLRGRETGIL